jgi:hypothetical protein
MSFDSYAQAYTTTQNDSEKLEHGRNNDVNPISKGAESPQWAGKDPLLHLPETKPLNVSRKIHDDPLITSVPTRPRPRNPTRTQLSYSSGEPEPENSIEYNPSTTSSVPTSQDRNPLTRARNRPQSQNPRETGRVSRLRKHNEDLPPLPTQDTSSSSSGPRLQYPQEIHTSYSQDLDVPLSIPSVRSEEPTQYNSPQTRSRTQQPRVTRISFANKPWDSDHLEPPSLRIQEKSQSNYSRTHSQPQETLSSIPWDLDHLESPSLPIQEKSQSNYSRTQPQRQEIPSKLWDLDYLDPPSLPIQEKSQFNSSRTQSQPEETQVSSDVNKSQDRAEQHPKDSIPTRDPDQDLSADADKTDTRPHLMRGTPSQMDTQYVNMLLALDDIPQLHNIFAGFFNWILLAGFILFPGTFTSLKNLGGNSGQAAQLLVHAVTSIPL